MKNPTKTYKVKIKQNTLTVAIDSTYLPENITYPNLMEKIIFDKHYHAWHEIFIISDEPTTLHCNNQIQQLTNCILVIPPMLKHTTFRGADYRVAGSYKKSGNEQGVQVLDSLFESTEPVIIPLPQGIMFYAREIEKQLLWEDEFSRERIESCLRLIFCEIAAARTKKDTVQRSDVNETYLETIESVLVNFRQNINLGTVAKELGLCTRQASRIIQKHYKTTFSEMLCDKRLDAACFLLASSDLSIAEIVERVNFPSESYFYARFKKRYGQTPQQYRRDHKA